MRLTLGIVMVIALAAASWWSFGGAGAPERVSTPAGDVARSNESAAVELAASARAARDRVRDAGAGEVLGLHVDVPRAATEAPAAASALPCGVRVVHRHAAVANAAVELWHVDTQEMIALVTDADGFARCDEELFARGPWLALAGRDGLCNRDLAAVVIAGDVRQAELFVDRTAHVGFDVERSDGTRIGRFEWAPSFEEQLSINFHGTVHRSFEFATGADGAVTRLGALRLGGLVHTGADVHFVLQSGDGDVPHADIVGRCREPDTEEVLVSCEYRSLADGGGLEHIVLMVDPTVRSGTLEVFVVGGPLAEPVEAHAAFDLVLESSGGRTSWTIRLSRSSAEHFEIPTGSWRARAYWDVFGSLDRTSTAKRHGTMPVDVVIESGRSTRLDIDLSSFGALEIVGSVDARRPDRHMNHVDFSDVERPWRSYVHLRSPLRSVCLVRPGTYCVTFSNGRDSALAVESDATLRDLCAHPRIGAGLEGSVGRLREALASEAENGSSDASLDPFLVRVEAGAVTVVRAARP
jgi:hypothetical protein